MVPNYDKETLNRTPTSPLEAPSTKNEVNASN